MSVALASGTSAVMYSLINIMSQGDNFVTASQLYGGTYTMFDNILPEYGINAKKVDITDLKAVEDMLVREAIFGKVILREFTFQLI